MDEHLGREKYARASEEDLIEKNYRNGISSKNVRSSYGDVNLDIPRDRNGEFNPITVKKNKKDCNEFDQKLLDYILVECLHVIFNQKLNNYMELIYRHLQSRI